MLERIAPRQRWRLRILIEFEDRDAIGMDRFENGVNGRFCLFVEDCEIYFDFRSSVGNECAGGSESLMVPTLGRVFG